MKAITDSKGYSVFKVIFILIILIALVITGIILYHLKSETPINSGTVSTKKATNISTSKGPLKPVTNPSKSQLISIAKFGLQIRVPNDLKDLVFVQTASSSTTNQQLNISTTILGTLDTHCSADTSDALGMLSKVSGTYPANQASKMTLVKQFSGYYIGYSTPNKPCSTKAVVQAKIIHDTTELQSALLTIN